MNGRNHRVAAAVAAAGIAPKIKILDADADADAKTAVAAAAGTADSVMSLTYEQLLALTEGVAAQVR